MILPERRVFIQDLIDKKKLEITPTAEERAKVDSIAKFLSEIIFNSLPKNEIIINFITPQGSTGLKDTALRNTSDIDLFIGLDISMLPGVYEKSKSQMRSEIRVLFKDLINNWLIPVLKENGIENPVMKYAEHPYISAEFQGMDLDIVFCFDIPEDFLYNRGPLTAVDRTPHHTRYIQEHLTSEQRDEVRVLKFLFKKLHCYGDKSPVGRSGFLGYIAELLVVKYGSVLAIMENFSDLESEVIFLTPQNPSLENPYRNQPIGKVRRKFFPNDFLVIIDPTDIHRNVGSSVSLRAYRVVKNAFQSFLEHPTWDFMNYSSLPDIRSCHQNYPLENFFYIQWHTTDYAHYTKFRDKIYSFLDKLIKTAQHEPTLEPRFEDVIGELIFEADKGKYVLALYSSTPEISIQYLRTGPDVNDLEHASKFKNKHPQAFIKDGKWTSLKNRKFTRFVDFLEDFEKNNRIKLLELEKIGTAIDPFIPELAAQSMGNLAIHILPYELSR